LAYFAAQRPGLLDDLTGDESNEESKRLAENRRRCNVAIKPPEETTDQTR